MVRISIFKHLLILLAPPNPVNQVISGVSPKNYELYLGYVKYSLLGLLGQFSSSELSPQLLLPSHLRANGIVKPAWHRKPSKVPGKQNHLRVMISKISHITSKNVLGKFLFSTKIDFSI